MNPKTYMILLTDRKRAMMFTLLDGIVGKYKEFVGEYVPQRVKHGDDTWDAQDKINRHIEDHLHRHLKKISDVALKFALENKIHGVIIGGHKEIIPKIKKLLKYPLNRKVKGEFVTELKAPFNEILRRAKITTAESL